MAQPDAQAVVVAGWTLESLGFKSTAATGQQLNAVVASWTLSALGLTCAAPPAPAPGSPPTSRQRTESPPPSEAVRAPEEEEAMETEAEAEPPMQPLPNPPSPQPQQPAITRGSGDYAGIAHSDGDGGDGPPATMPILVPVLVRHGETTQWMDAVGLTDLLCGNGDDAGDQANSVAPGVWMTRRTGKSVYGCRPIEAADKGWNADGEDCVLIPDATDVEVQWALGTEEAAAVWASKFEPDIWAVRLYKLTIEHTWMIDSNRRLPLPPSVRARLAFLRELEDLVERVEDNDVSDLENTLAVPPSSSALSPPSQPPSMQAAADYITAGNPLRFCAFEPILADPAYAVLKQEVLKRVLVNDRSKLLLGTLAVMRGMVVSAQSTLSNYNEIEALMIEMQAYKPSRTETQSLNGLLTECQLRIQAGKPEAEATDLLRILAKANRKASPSTFRGLDFAVLAVGFGADPMQCGGDGVQQQQQQQRACGIWFATYMYMLTALLGDDKDKEQQLPNVQGLAEVLYQRTGWRQQQSDQGDAAIPLPWALAHGLGDVLYGSAVLGMGGQQPNNALGLGPNADNVQDKEYMKRYWQSMQVMYNIAGAWQVTVDTFGVEVLDE